MSFFKEPIYRDKKYLKFVSTLPCSCCGMPDYSVAHHIIGVGDGKMGGKACDLLTQPLCVGCHTEMHNNPDWWITQWEAVSKTLQAAINSGYKFKI